MRIQTVRGIRVRVAELESIAGERDTDSIGFLQSFFFFKYYYHCLCNHEYMMYITLPAEVTPLFECFMVSSEIPPLIQYWRRLVRRKLEMMKGFRRFSGVNYCLNNLYINLILEG